MSRSLRTWQQVHQPVDINRDSRSRDRGVASACVTDRQADVINTRQGKDVDYLGGGYRGIKPCAVTETPVSLVNADTR